MVRTMFVVVNRVFFGKLGKKTPCLVEATSPSLDPGIREMYSISTLTALD